MKLNTLILTASLGLAVGAASTQAGIIFASNPSGSWNEGGNPGAMGTLFTVGASGATISSLGYFDEGGDGLDYAHTVGIFKLDLTLLGSVAVPGGTAAPLHDGTRWAGLLTPISLTANNTYMLAYTLGATGDPVNVVDPSATVTIGPGFTLAGDGYWWVESLIFAYPTQPGPPGYYVFGGNMETGESVPEPGQWAMMAVTALGIAGYAARRVRAKANLV